MNLKISFANPPDFKFFEKSEAIKNVQQLLTELGYDVGKAGVDGIYGNDTKAALGEFISLGKIKKNGKISEATLKRLTEIEAATDGYKPLSWEKDDPSRKNWSAFVFKTIDQLFDSSFSLCEDITRFRKNYHSLNRTQKINVWGELVSAICKYESNWKPTSRMEEPGKEIDEVTGNYVQSEGLMQLSYQDKKTYMGKVKIPCKFDWAADKPLFSKNPKDPAITILNPYYNLEFGISILAFIIEKRKKIVLSDNVYWAVLKENGKYEKINEIAGYVEKLKL